MASQTLRTLKLSLLADVSGFGSELDKAGSSFSKFSKGVEKASKFANVAIGAIGGLAISAIDAASDLEETSSAVEQIFGQKASRDLQQFARDAARAIGLSRQQALTASQQFGIFGQAAGLAGDDLTEFTTDLVTLAADLASFNNTTVDEAITALGAALRGESEPIRNYGVLLNAAAIENRALSDGLIESKEELDAQTKILATFGEIFDQTAIQQGDYGRTSESLANQQKTLTSELANFRVEIGEELLPIVNAGLPLIRGWVETLTSADPQQVIAIAGAIGTLAVAVTSLNAALKVFAGLQAAAKFLFSTGGALLVALAAGGSAVTDPTNPRFSGYEGLSQQEAEFRARQAAGEFAPVRANPDNQPAQQVIINGIVAGSSYQVYRELELQLAAGTRAGIGAAR